VMKMAHSGAMCHLYIVPDFVPIFIPGFSVQVSVLALLTPRMKLHHKSFFFDQTGLFLGRRRG